jgi:hypothetical protein
VGAQRRFTDRRRLLRMGGAEGQDKACANDGCSGGALQCAGV